jgi:uncharacterized HAD superfamily protein
LRIAVDIDGTITDNRLLTEKLLDFYGLPYPDGPFLYDYSDLGVTHSMLHEFLRKEGHNVFSSAVIQEGCRDVMNKWYRKGYSVYLVTARSDYLEDITREWLLRHGLLYDKLYFMPYKTLACALLDAHIIIDDCYDNVVSCANIGTIGYLLDAPYNQGPEHPLVERVHSWAQIESKVDAMREVELEAANERLPHSYRQRNVRTKRVGSA